MRFRPLRKPELNFTQLAAMGENDGIDLVPPEWQKQAPIGTRRFFRTGPIGKLALNLSRGRYYLNAGHDRHDRGMWVTSSQDEARSLATTDFVLGSQFRPGELQALGELMGRDDLDPMRMSTIVYGITLPDRIRTYQSDETAHLIDRRVTFAAMDEYSHRALGELLQTQLPTK